MPAGWRAVEPPRRPVLLINPRSGGGTAARAELAEKAQALAIECLELQPGQDLAVLAEQAAARGADALGIAGGDGSLAVVAAVARARGVPFICVPAGTRNHFALDVGVDRHDVVGALRAFIEGLERSIDVGEVNGRMFLNNVSLGIYGDAVQQPGYREAKVRTLLETAREVLGPSGATPPIDVVDDRGREHRRPAVLLVSNNPYALKPGLRRGMRQRLDGGRLGIVVLDAPRDGGGGYAWTAPSLEITPDAPVHAGIDGEPVTLQWPLHIVIRPRELRVRIPRPGS